MVWSNTAGVKVNNTIHLKRLKNDETWLLVSYLKSFGVPLIASVISYHFDYPPSKEGV